MEIIKAGESQPRAPGQISDLKHVRRERDGTATSKTSVGF
jgi:hypothetical protein